MIYFSRGRDITIIILESFYLKILTKLNTEEKRWTHEKWAEHVERYEVGKCNVRTTADWIVSFVAVIIALNVRARRASHHDFLPPLACNRKHSIDHIFLSNNFIYYIFVGKQIYVISLATMRMRVRARKWNIYAPVADLNKTNTACGKDWKLLLRFIGVSSSIAIFPKTCEKENVNCCHSWQRFSKN